MVVTWNPTDKGTGVTLSNGNLRASGIMQNNSVKSSETKISGKWYCEIKIDTVNYTYIGIAQSNAPMTSTMASSPNFCGYYFDGRKTVAGTTSAYGTAYTSGDTIGIYLDMDSRSVTFYKNGVNQGVANTGFTGMTDCVIVATSGTVSSSGIVTANFGATPFLFVPDRTILPFGVKSFDSSQALSPENKSMIQDNEGYKVYTKGSSAIPKENIIPVMINETTPAPYIASASSSYSSYTASNAFNRIFNGSSRWIANTVPPVWCKISLDKPRKAYSYQLSTGTASQAITSWILQGSNNNADWTDLDTVTNHTLPVEKYEEFQIDIPNEYQHYRVYATATLNNGLASLSGFTLLTEEIPATNDKWELISSVTPTQSQFKNKGMDSLDIFNRKVATLDPKNMSDKSEILLGEEGSIFAYSIDLKKYFDIRKIAAKGVK